VPDIFSPRQYELHNEYLYSNALPWHAEPWQEILQVSTRRPTGARQLTAKTYAYIRYLPHASTGLPAARGAGAGRRAAALPAGHRHAAWQAAFTAPVRQRQTAVGGPARLRAQACSSDPQACPARARRGRSQRPALRVMPNGSPYTCANTPWYHARIRCWPRFAHVQAASTPAARPPCARHAGTRLTPCMRSLQALTWGSSGPHVLRLALGEPARRARAWAGHVTDPRACTWCSAASSHQSPALCMRHTCSPRSSCACAGALHHKHSVSPGTGRGTLRAPGARRALLLRAGPAQQPNTRCLARQAPKGSTLRAPPATLSITLPGKCWAFC